LLFSLSNHPRPNRKWNWVIRSQFLSSLFVPQLFSKHLFLCVQFISMQTNARKTPSADTSFDKGLSFRIYQKELWVGFFNLPNEITQRRKILFSYCKKIQR